MTDRRGTQIYRGTKSEVESDNSTANYGTVFVSTDRYTLTFVDENGDHQPIVPSINDVATAAAVDGAVDYVLMYDASAGVETKVLLDDIVSATVLGTDLSLIDKTATTYTVASSTGTNAQLTSATTSLAGLMTGSDKTKLDGIESGATADQTGAEIKTAYEAEANTNAFTDAEQTKLSGIETGATADQNLFETIAVSGQSDIVADGTKDTLTVAGGNEIDVTTNATTDTLTIARAIPPYISVRNTSGTTGIGATDTVITLNSITEFTDVSEWALVSNEVTAKTAGIYDISFNATMNDSSTSGRASVEVRLQHWNGSTWSTIPGTQVDEYIRGTGDGTTLGARILYQLAANDKVRIVAVRATGTTTAIFQKTNGTSFTMIWVTV
jgi:hypothetical protein